MTFVVRTPNGVVAQGECEFVVVPTTRGEMGVLADHAPVVAAVAPGQLRVTAGAHETRIGVGAGLVDVLDNVVGLFVVDAGSGGAAGSAG